MRSLSKKITSVLLSLAMIFTLMPAVSGPAYAADIVVLPSGEVPASTLGPGHDYQVPNEGTTIVLEDGDDVTIDSIMPNGSSSVLTIKGSDSGKLTVTNGINMQQADNGLIVEGGILFIDRTASDDWESAIAVSHYTQHGGNVTAKITNDTGINVGLMANYGFLMDGGVLEASARNESTLAYGIICEGHSGGRFVLNDGKITLTARGSSAYCIKAQDADITGGEIYGTAIGNSGSAYGLTSHSYKTSTLTMKGGKVNMSANGAASAAALSTPIIDIEGGTLTGTATSSAGYAYGIDNSVETGAFTMSEGSVDMTAACGPGCNAFGLDIAGVNITGGYIKARAKDGYFGYGIWIANSSGTASISDTILDITSHNSEVNFGIGTDGPVSLFGTTVTIDTGATGNAYGIRTDQGGLTLTGSSVDVTAKSANYPCGLDVQSLKMTDSTVDMEVDADTKGGSGADVDEGFFMQDSSLYIDVASGGEGSYGIITNSGDHNWTITDSEIEVNVVSSADGSYGCHGIENNHTADKDLVSVTDSTIKTTCKAPSAFASGFTCYPNLTMNGKTTIEAIGESGTNANGIYVRGKLTMTGDQAVLYGKGAVTTGNDHYGIWANGGIYLEEGAGYKVTKPIGGVIEDGKVLDEAGGNIAEEGEIEVPRHRLYLTSFDTEDNQYNKPYFLIASNVTGDTPQPSPREYWLKEGENVRFSVSVDDSAPYNYDFYMWRISNANGTDFAASPEAGIVMGTSDITLCAVMKRHYDTVDNVQLVSDMTEILAGETAGDSVPLIEKTGATASQYNITSTQWKDMETESFMGAGDTFVRGKTYKLYIYAFADGSAGYIWADTVDATYNGEPLTREGTNTWTKTFVANEYHTVTFDPRNGSGTWTEKVEWGNAATKPGTDPVRDGWDFDSWGKDSVTGMNYFSASSSNQAITADTTLYARYSAVLKASASGGKVAVKPAGEGVTEEDYTTSILIPVNEKTEGPITSKDYTLYAKVNEGYLFGGWYKFNPETSQYDLVSGEYTIDIAFTGNATYKAVFDRDPDFVPHLRIYGSSRYETAYSAANYLKELKGDDKLPTVIIADGRNFADALSGSYLAKVTESPILLVHPIYEEEVFGYIQSNVEAAGKVYLLGGTGAISEDFEGKLNAAGYDVKRLGGSDRFATNILILKEANSIDSTVAKELLVCSGMGFADALSTSSVGKPILLVGKTLSEGQKDYIREAAATDAWIIGGTGAVNEDIENELKGFVPENRIYRLNGSNRFETSLLVAEEFFPGSRTTAVLVYGLTFPDGLSGGAVASFIGAPVLLCTDQVATNGPAATWVRESGAYKSITFGGPKLIPLERVRAIMDQPDMEIVVYGA